MGMAGGGQGIGRAFAHALGEAGAAIAVVDINGEKAEAVRDELAIKGVRAIAITADITKASVCTRCKHKILVTLDMTAAGDKLCGRLTPKPHAPSAMSQPADTLRGKTSRRAAVSVSCRL